MYRYLSVEQQAPIVALLFNRRYGRPTGPGNPFCQVSQFEAQASHRHSAELILAIHPSKKCQSQRGMKKILENGSIS
jgi:hypothetical protein